MSKTCSTCKYCRIGDERVDQTSYRCAPLGKVFNIRLMDVLSCTHHEEKREPLRLECECWWESNDTLGNTIINPIGDNLRNKLLPFVGKRTKMTLDEIVE